MRDFILGAAATLIAALVALYLIGVWRGATECKHELSTRFHSRRGHVDICDYCGERVYLVDLQALLR